MISFAVVLGGSGYLGRNLLARLGTRGVGTYNSRPLPGLIRFDGARDSLSALLSSLPKRPSHVFIPFGAIDAERCAREPAATMVVNVVSVVRILEEAIGLGLVPVFFSTDYVFDGEAGGYRETDCLRPRTSYGAQKAAVELWLNTVPAPSIVARLSKVVGPETNVQSVLGQWTQDIRHGKPQRAATDQVFSPAWVGDVAKALIELCDRGATGVWNVAGAEPISRHDLLMMLLEEVQRIAPQAQIDVTPCSIRDLPFAERRPLNTSLQVAKLESFLDWRFRSLRELCADAARANFLTA